jgi:hypothetical protein
MYKRIPLVIGEEVRAGIYRSHSWGYNKEPDEIPCVDDLVVDTGRIFLAKKIGAANTADSAMLYMAIGTATTAPALGDTTLPGEIKRKLSSISSATVNNRYTNVATWGGSSETISSVAITEAGVFNAAASGAGTMFQRVTFASVVLANSDLLKVELTTIVGSNTI